MSESPRLIIPALGRIYGAAAPVTEPAIRAVAGLSLAAHGFPKLFGATEASVSFFEKTGFHPPLFWTILTGCTEFFGGLCLAAGLLTRVVAAPILVFLLIAVLYHASNGFYWNRLGFEYPLFWAIVVFHFLVRGGGVCSLDAVIGREV
jgi:putative oxidoreductase